MGLFDRGKRTQKKESENDIVDHAEVVDVLSKAQEHNWQLQTGQEDAEVKLPCRIVDLDSGKGAKITLRFYDAPICAAGEELHAVFETLDWRYSFTTAVEDLADGNRCVCQLPEVLRDAERRRSLRARVRKNETVQVAAISQIFQGEAATGPLVEFSKRGFVFRPAKIISVATQETLRLSAAQFSIGKLFMVIRVKFPGMIREAEFSGKVTRVWGVPPGLVVAMDFEGIQGADSESVSRSVEGRTGRRPASGPLFADERFAREEAKEEEEASAGPVKKEQPPEGGESGARVAEAQQAPPPAEAARTPGSTAQAVEVAAPPPASASPAATQKRHVEPAPAPPQPSPAAILLVGDTATTRLQLKNGLRLHGYNKVEQAESAQVALQCLTEFECDLMIVSTELEDLPAQQLIKIVHSQPALFDLPIVALARAPSPADIVGLRAAGVREIVLKPVDMSVLAEKIGKLLTASP